MTPPFANERFHKDEILQAIRDRLAVYSSRGSWGSSRIKWPPSALPSATGFPGPSTFYSRPAALGGLCAISLRSLDPVSASCWLVSCSRRVLGRVQNGQITGVISDPAGRLSFSRGYISTIPPRNTKPISEAASSCPAPELTVGSYTVRSRSPLQAVTATTSS